MSKENAQNFMKMIGEGGELQDKVKAAVESYTGNKLDVKEVFDNVLAPIAKEKGFDISFDDAKEFLGIAGDGELSADALKNFSGGFKWPWK